MISSNIQHQNIINKYPEIIISVKFIYHRLPIIHAALCLYKIRLQLHAEMEICRSVSFVQLFITVNSITIFIIQLSAF